MICYVIVNVIIMLSATPPPASTVIVTVCESGIVPLIPRVSSSIIGCIVNVAEPPPAIAVAGVAALTVQCAALPDVMLTVGTAAVGTEPTFWIVKVTGGGGAGGIGSLATAGITVLPDMLSDAIAVAFVINTIFVALVVVLVTNDTYILLLLTSLTKPAHVKLIG